MISAPTGNPQTCSTEGVFGFLNVGQMIEIELGLPGVLMGVGLVFLTKELVFAKKQVKEYKKDNSNLVEKIHLLGIEVTAGVTASNSTLDKLYDLFIKFLVKEKEGENNAGGS